jgi:hypothetical protein
MLQIEEILFDVVTSAMPSSPIQSKLTPRDQPVCNLYAIANHIQAKDLGSAVWYLITHMSLWYNQDPSG